MLQNCLLKINTNRSFKGLYNLGALIKHFSAAWLREDNLINYHNLTTCINLLVYLELLSPKLQFDTKYIEIISNLDRYKGQS